MLDVSPAMLVTIILVITAVSGALMWWSSGPRKRH
jgi:hypothetical protein